MKVNININKKFVVNGKEYTSLAELPAALREAYERAVETGQVHTVQKPSHIVFDGHEYASPEEMPADVRPLYEAAMKALRDNNSPASNASIAEHAAEASTALHEPAPIVPESSVNARTILVAAAVLILLFLFYLAHSGAGR